jgi:AraC-like DNA-binding protein
MGYPGLTEEFAASAQPASFASALRLALRSTFGRADLDADCHARPLATRFGIHERTLYRRLRADGTTFGRELAHARREIAARLLRETDWPLVEIALALSYAESTSFVRAFKRWTGVTPARYRARARKRPDLADRLDVRLTKKASPGGAGTG